MGQCRLERVFQALGFKTQQEDKAICINTSGDVKDYQVDVIVMDDNYHALFACEVDTYTYAIDGAKSVPNMRNRDSLIEEQHHYPVVRYDILALREGRRKTKYYMTDREIAKFAVKQYKKYLMKNAVKINFTVVDSTGIEDKFKGVSPIEKI